MADAPPPVAGSSLQAGFLAHEISKDREARRAGEAITARRQATSVTEAGDTVETTDSDARVFSEAEGGGSQGRAFEAPTPEDENLSPQDPGDPSSTLDINA